MAPGDAPKTSGPVREYDMTLKQEILAWLMDPNMSFVLLAIGMLALYAEFNHPGAIIPGVVGFFFMVPRDLCVEHFASALLGAGTDRLGIHLLRVGGEVHEPRCTYDCGHCFAYVRSALAGGFTDPADARASLNGPGGQHSSRIDNGVPDDDCPPRTTK